MIAKGSFEKGILFQVMETYDAFLQCQLLILLYLTEFHIKCCQTL